VGTTAQRPFRFGVQVGKAADGPAFTDLAKKAEDLGYATLTVPDHLDDQWAPTPMLMAAADVTTTLRLGALVWCNDYRHPVVLAKEAATLDLLSAGRLELGLGAGWMTSDYESAGLSLDRAGTRIDRMAEAISILKGLMGDEPVDFDGSHYRIEGLDGLPKPVQKPHPPIVIGGGGRKILGLAAREADVVGLNIDLRSGHIDETAGPTATADATHEKLHWIRETAGPRFDDIELQVRVHLAAITDDVPALAEAMAPAFGLTPEQAAASPHALAGSVDQIVDTLEERRTTYGISYIGLSADVIDDLAPVVARLAGR
jgi:probable F420-dependent oxidoreductase